MPRTMNVAARYHPGARSRADISRTTSSLRRLRQVLHERIHLGTAQGTPVIGGHDPLAVALGDLRVGLLDRLLDERRVLALEDLVEVGSGRAVRARRRQRVAGAAGRRARAVLAVREQGLRVGRARVNAAARGATARAACALWRAGLPQPRREVRLGHDVRRLAHEGVAEAAQLRAHDLVVADRRALGRDAVARRDAGHRVDLHAEVRHPEVVDDVLGVDLDLHRLVARKVELRPAQALAPLLVLEGPLELLAEDLDDALRLAGGQRGRLLDVAQDDVRVHDEADDERRRDRGPDDLEPGVAVDRRAVDPLL